MTICSVLLKITITSYLLRVHVYYIPAIALFQLLRKFLQVTICDLKMLFRLLLYLNKH